MAITANALNKYAGRWYQNQDDFSPTFWEKVNEEGEPNFFAELGTVETVQKAYGTDFLVFSVQCGNDEKVFFAKHYDSDEDDWGDDNSYIVTPHIVTEVRYY